MNKLVTITNAIGIAALVLLPAFNAQAKNTSGIEPRSYLPQLAIATLQATNVARNSDYVAGFVSDMDEVLKRGPSPDLLYVQTSYKDGTEYYGFIEPNYKNVSVCVTDKNGLVGAWNIHPNGITPIPLNGQDCFTWGRGIVAAYKAQGVKFVGATPK
jgi:hypothetical protein